MAGRLLSLYCSSVVPEDLPSFVLFSGDFDDLSSHLTTGQTRVATDLHRIKLMIGRQRSVQPAGSSSPVSELHSDRFTSAHPSTQEIFDIAGQLSGIPDRTILYRSLQSGRKGVPTGREETVDKA